MKRRASENQACLNTHFIYYSSSAPGARATQRGHRTQPLPLLTGTQINVAAAATHTHRWQPILHAVHNATPHSKFGSWNRMAVATMAAVAAVAATAMAAWTLMEIISASAGMRAVAAVAAVASSSAAAGKIAADGTKTDRMAAAAAAALSMAAMDRIWAGDGRRRQVRAIPGSTL